MIRILLIGLLFACSIPARAAATDDEDWTAFGQVLTLVQTMVRIGLQPNPDQAIGDLLAGRNYEANGALAGLFAGATADMPPEYRDRIASIGRELAGYVASHPVTRAIEAPSLERALQARKDLNAMGLSYYDPKQFLDAVKRDDALAAELYIEARGVNLSARDADGRSALEIARANGNTRLAQVLAKNLPAAR